MGSMLLKIESLRVNMYGKEILHDVSLEIRQGEQWAIFGAAGTGKTVLAHTLAGYHAYGGRIDFPILPESGSDKSVMVIDQQHRFRDLRNQNQFYYQQRYNALDAEATITVGQDLAAFDENGTGFITKAGLLEIFHLTPLLHEPLIQLSNGENKRLQILKAVLGFHRILILDEPFTGLDRRGRQLLDDLMSVLSASGQHLVLLGSRDHIPDCFNRFAKLESGTLHIKKNADEVRIKQAETIPPVYKTFPSALSFSYPDFRFAVRMQQVHVLYEGRFLLEGINWEVEKGSCWALSGPNGAGKSTLLSLITADNPQAYANEIYLFDRKRGSGESIWEIKQKIGYLSPELQLYFDPAATAFTTIASGLFDTIGLFRQLAPLQEQLVWEWLEYLDCKGLAHRLLTSLPAGMQRLILLGRAMIKTPPLLVLDEPFQGLDAAQTAFAMQMTDHFCTQYACSLIFVSHYNQDFPTCISQSLRLEKGKMV
ncbi:MAG TPA: ABC transporter [Chitinophagaceae bacterium]|nr:ABC transporter [Chitinophagaceae bacterium]